MHVLLSFFKYLLSHNNKMLEYTHSPQVQCGRASETLDRIGKELLNIIVLL